MVQLSDSVASMIATLRGHARQLETEVAERTRELTVANAELTRALDVIQKNERAVRDDIENARLFQAKMLPPAPTLAGCDFAVRYVALERVSGDIYDVSPLEPPLSGLRLFLADATGHGVQASMRTIVLKSAYDRLRPRERDPRRLLEALNAYIVHEFPEGELHASASYVEVSLTAKGADVTYLSAGGAPLYVFAPGAPAREVYAPGPLLGVDHVTMPEPERFELAANELLLVPSDGLVEQLDPERRRFEAELTALGLAEAPTAAAALDQVLAAFDAFRRTAKRTDDLTLLAVSPRAAGPTRR
jgi:serine phosphatase RsbU (regulator of sigma subunit)